MDHLTISTSNNLSSTFEIVDLIGRKLLTGMSNHSSKTVIDISSLSSGMSSL